MTTSYQERSMPAPHLQPGDEPFFEAAAEGRLLIKRCADCNQVHFYPRALCPFCMSERTEWLETRGEGEIYTYTVTRRVGPVPYVLAYVTLDEGVTMMTNLVDCDFDSLRIGQRVRVVFKPTTEDGPKVPCFTPM